MSQQPQTPSLLPNPTTPSSSSSSGIRIFFSALALILFGTLVGVVAARFLPQDFTLPFLTPTPTVTITPLLTPTPTIDPTIGWEIYTDSLANYSIKYPPEAKLSFNTKPTIDIVYIGITQQQSGRTQTELSDGYKINVAYENLAPGQTLQTTANTALRQVQTSESCPSPENIIISPLTSLSISNEPALQFSVKNCFADYTIYFVEKTGKLFTLTAIYPAFTPAQQLIYQNETAEIISTFKFLGASATATPNIGQKIVYQLPFGWQKVTDKTNTFEVGFNPETQTGNANTTLAYENAVAITDKNSDNNPYYSPHANSIYLWLLPYDNGSRHTFIETQVLKEKLSLHFKTGVSLEKEYVVQGKNCLVFYKLEDLSQGHTTYGMCPVSSSTALVFSSFFDESKIKPMLQTLKLL